jgi:glutaredoxin
MTSSPLTGATSASITLVVSSGCHFCRDAQDALEEIGHDFPIQVTTIDLRSPQGLRLAQQFRASMSPLVLVDGQFLSAGRLPRGKLRALLSARAAQTASAS